MRKLSWLTTILMIAGCRGEPVPRDYQNSPPGVSHPADSQSQTPTAQGQRMGSAEPSRGAEGTSGPYKTIEPVTTTASTPVPATTSSTAPITTTTTSGSPK